MIKLIAVDMDGTLLNSDHKISKENLEAIKKAEEKGIKVAICTGRNYEEAKPLLDEVGLRCECVLSSGAEYRDTDGNIIEAINMDKESAGRAIDIMLTLSNRVEVITNEGMYTPCSKE